MPAEEDRLEEDRSGEPGPRQPEPGPQPEPEQGAGVPTDRVSTDPVGADRGPRRFAPDKVSAWAAVAGVVVAGLSLYLGTRGDAEDSTPGGGGRAGPSLGPVVVVSADDAIDAEGTYERLAQDQAVVFMVQPAEDDPEDDTWITMMARQTPTEEVDGTESGTWTSRWPVTDPRQAWRHAAGIGPAVAQGVDESPTLRRLAEEGPESSLLSEVTEVVTYTPAGEP